MSRGFYDNVACSTHDPCHKDAVVSKPALKKLIHIGIQGYAMACGKE